MFTRTSCEEVIKKELKQNEEQIEKNVDIKDLTPTILSIYDQLIPQNIDGKLILNIFREEFNVGIKDFRVADAEKTKISQTIRNLNIKKEI